MFVAKIIHFLGHAVGKTKTNVNLEKIKVVKNSQFLK
jgi:hypothetical protein